MSINVFRTIFFKNNPDIKGLCLLMFFIPFSLKKSRHERIVSINVFHTIFFKNSPDMKGLCLLMFFVLVSLKIIQICFSYYFL